MHQPKFPKRGNSRSPTTEPVDAKKDSMMNMLRTSLIWSQDSGSWYKTRTPEDGVQRLSDKPALTCVPTLLRPQQDRFFVEISDISRKMPTLLIRHRHFYIIHPRITYKLHHRIVQTFSPQKIPTHIPIPALHQQKNMDLYIKHSTTTTNHLEQSPDRVVS